MSVFAILKRSRQRAKEENQKLAEKAQKENVKAPYRHVPTHAAVDALSGAPSSWRFEDRPRILEQNRRRSAMAASGMGTGMPGIPRVASSLSHVTYPSAAANPMVHQMPRAYSYTGVPAMPMTAWHERGGDVIYSIPDSGSGSLKGKERERSHVYGSGRTSSASSKGGSPVASSSNSTSEDDLEMKPTVRHSAPTQPLFSQQQQGRAANPGGSAHRLHPSHPRRASDASIDRVDLTPNMSKTSLVQPTIVADRRPPPSTRGFSSIPPVPALPPMQFGSGVAPPVSSSSASVSSIPSSTPPMSLSSFNFSTNASNTTSANSSISMSVPITPATLAISEPKLEPLSMPIENPVPAAGSAGSAPTLKHKERRVSKVARFTELETIDSNTGKPLGAPYENIPRSERAATAPLPISHEAVTQYMSEQQPQVTPPQAITPPSKSGKRLSKQPAGAKLTKKNRWSMKGGNSAVAV